MIIKEAHNTPVASPEFSDMTAALEVFRTFRDEPLHTMSDLVTFLANPSSERDAFLELFEHDAVIWNNRYVIIKCS
jgi:hypothetical protein